MAMINVWYPKEVGAGVDIKEVLPRTKNLSQLGGYLNGRLNVGHSSLLLDRIQHPVYISWWPQAPATRTPTWKVDVTEEGGNPNALISLDDLDEEAIAVWWSGLISSRTGARGGYEFVTYNCSTVVADALTAGGAEKLAPRPIIKMWTPSQIEDWAKELLSRSNVKTNGIFRHGGIGNFLDSSLRRIASELGANVFSR